MEIQRQKLMEILSIVKPGIASKAIIDQATHFIFTGDKILTYNDRICICFPLETDFKGSVPGEEFYKIIGEMKGENIDFIHEQDKLKFKCGSFKAALSMNSEDEIMSFVNVLKIPSIDSNWKSIPKDFINALSLCIFSTARSMLGGKQFINCLSIDKDIIVSSDNQRVTRYFLESAIEDSFLLPLSSTIELVKLNNIDGYILGDSWIYFKTIDGVIFSSRIIDDQYPNIDSLFDFDSMEIKFPEDFKQIIETVAVLAPGETDLDKIIDITIGNGTIKCRGEKSVGWIEGNQKIIYSGPNIVFSINPIFLLQILTRTNIMGYSEKKVFFSSESFDHIVSLIASKE